MNQRMINVGFGNSVVASRILLVVNPKSAPIRKLKEEAKIKKKLIDVTEGRKTRSIIILDTSHVILSAIQTETITLRFSSSPLDDKDQP